MDAQCVLCEVSTVYFKGLRSSAVRRNTSAGSSWPSVRSKHWFSFCFEAANWQAPRARQTEHSAGPSTPHSCSSTGFRRFQLTFIRHFNAMEHHFCCPSFTFREVAPNPWLADNLLPATKCHFASGDIYNDRMVLFTPWCCLTSVLFTFCTCCILRCLVCIVVVVLWVLL